MKTPVTQSRRGSCAGAGRHIRLLFLLGALVAAALCSPAARGASTFLFYVDDPNLFNDGHGFVQIVPGAAFTAAGNQNYVYGFYGATRDKFGGPGVIKND